MYVLQRKEKFLLTVFFNSAIIFCLVKWLLHNVHLHELIQDVAKVSGLSIGWTLLLGILVSFLYGLRLKLLLNTSLVTGWSLIAIGNGLNNILPFRFGDILRVYFAREYYQISINKTVFTTFVERFLDLTALLCMGGLPILFVPILRESVFGYILIGLISCALLAWSCYKLLIHRNFLQRFLPNFVLNISEIKVKQKHFIVTLFLWFSLVLQYFAFFHGNLTDSNLSLPYASMLCFITTLSFAIPYMVAGIGVFESAIIYFLVHFVQVDPTEAAALALLYHLVFSLPQIMLGVIMIVYCKLAGSLAETRIDPANL